MATLTLDVFHHNNIASRMASIIEYLQFSFLCMINWLNLFWMHAAD